MNEASCPAEMPKYQSHKKVWALKIKAIDGQSITPEEDRYSPFLVSTEYLEKHKPQLGGYYVVYEDGYKSFSPADAFEAGNILLGSSTEDIETLMRFYDAESLLKLISEQADHVRQLQAQLKPFIKEPHQIVRVREG